MPQHGIPQIWLSDGPHGLRKQAGESDHLGLNPSVPATCFPTASAVANSWDTALGEEIGAALGEEAAARYDAQMRQMQAWYAQWQQELGAKGESSNEDARFVLPNACETRLIVTMNTRELLHFFELRCCSRAQWEIRALATEMLRLCRKTAPVLFADAGPGCLRGACPEGTKSCGKATQIRRKFAQL